jgi:hypothetical protein
MIDYITPAMRLAAATSLEAKRAEANAYLDARKISVLRHGYTPTKACETDVKRTMVRATSERITQDCVRYVSGIPMFLRPQAS